MDITELVELLGQSHKNKIANKKLQELGFEILSPNDEYSGVPFLVNLLHNNLTIKLTFNGYKYYKANYGEPKNYTEKRVKELILQFISIDFENINLAIQKKFILPLGIKSTDYKDDILELLRANYNTVIKFIDDKGLTFNYEEYFVLISFQESGIIKNIYISLKGINEKIRTKLELELELQKINTLRDNVKDLLAILDPTPDLDWDYQENWGNIKSKKNITKIYSQLKNALILDTKHSNPFGIYHSVKVTVLELNEAQKLGFIIDTHEREKLCSSIDKLVKATGFSTYGIDITSKWREW